MESYSLFQLNEYIRRVIALNFREPLWIEAELIQAKDTRGNWYLELVEKKESSDEVIAQASAAIWYRNFAFIRKKLGDLVYELLTPGTQIRVKCTVDFHERYGLKLIIQDIDPNYTFGRLEINRQKVIERLKSEGLFDLNASLPLPSVFKSIAVISSAGAAGYKDFMAQLTNNVHGYAFKTKLFEASVQGQKLEKETIAAMDAILAEKNTYDAVVLIRGGGSKLDLSGYDNYAISCAIAKSGIPFITGIGHEIDLSIVDMVACISLKTPTAVANHLIEHNLFFESGFENTANQVFQLSLNILKQHSLFLQAKSEQIISRGRLPVQDGLLRLSRTDESIRIAVRHLLQIQAAALKQTGTAIKAVDPVRILESGYAYITRGEQNIYAANQLKKDDIIDIHLHDGMRQSKIL